MSFFEAVAPYLIGSIFVLLIVFLILRQFMLWYWRVNVVVAELAVIRASLLRLELSASGGQLGRPEQPAGGNQPGRPTSALPGYTVTPT